MEWKNVFEVGITIRTKHRNWERRNLVRMKLVCFKE